MKRYAIATAVLLIFGTIFAASKLYTPSYTQTDFAMDTIISITANGKNAKSCSQLAIDEVKRIDDLMSATKKQSDIFAINSAPQGTKVKISKETFELLQLAVDVSQKTDGAFDVTIKPVKDLWDIKSKNPKVPKQSQIESNLKNVGYENIILDEKTYSVALINNAQIDLGGIAKGYAADCAAKVLHQNGIKNALIDLGGNVYALGKNKKGKDWKIGIQKPFATRGEYFRVVQISNKATVTSGAYERYFEKNGKIYHHIIDPATGYPACSGIKSSTVVCSNSALADALSTAVFVAGADKAKEFKKSYPNAEFVILDDNDEVVRY